LSELSSLLFVDTDELGRPTGLVASEETDTFASALMPQDVKDTVVAVYNNSGTWNESSSVSGFTDVSSIVYNNSGTWNDASSVAFEIIGDVIYPIEENLTLDMGGGADRSFITSGLSKTLLEFDDKSRVALGRNSVPLEISAFGESDVRLEDDGTDGAFVLIKGTRVGDAPSISQVHLQSADLSADADCQINFDADINMSDDSYLRGDTIGSNFLECKNVQSFDLSAGTPVHITNFFGDTKVEVIEASAGVSSSMPAVGILAQDLTPNQQGLVDIFGVTDGIDTNSFDEGDVLYVAVSGGITNVRPTGTGELVQNIGIVAKASNNGRIVVLGAGRTNDVPNTPTKLLSTNYTGTGNIPTSLTTVDWASPTLNNGNITYSAGEFTIPAAMAGDYLEFNIQLGTDTGITPGRIKLEMELQKDTGSGYTTEAAAADYVVRNDSIDRGSISISGYIDPAAVSSGDKYRVQVLQVAEGNAGQFWPDACKISIKSHHP